MAPYDDYLAARDYAGDCFKIMLDLYTEVTGLLIASLTANLAPDDDDGAARLVRRDRLARANAAYDTAADIYRRAEDARHAAFNRYLAEVKV